jgi:hypothetical protein
VRALLESPGESETPFALDLGPWRVNGRFDKLCRVPAGLELVDWKTDEADDRAAVVNQYRAQMILYALALWRTGRADVNANRLTVRLVLLHAPCVAPLAFNVDELLHYEQHVRSEFAAMEAALRVPNPPAGKPALTPAAGEPC